MTIEDNIQSIKDQFSQFDDWLDKYNYLIELGKELPLIETKNKTEDYLIKGCQSRVWLYPEIKEGKLYFTADSDAVITKGLAALVISVFSGNPPAEIFNAPTDFINEIGLTEHLSPTRSNGLVSMLKQIKLYAFAFQSKI
ncbi:MAG: SufE family protein [Lentimicrobiaceae bacterium]|nr:SufE family protein [Lentimicrobiaceae bacterium]